MLPKIITLSFKCLLSFFIFRYQFFLQLKQDLLADRLECPYNLAVTLSALSLQCEFKSDSEKSARFPLLISPIFFSSRDRGLWPGNTQRRLRLRVPLRPQPKWRVRDWRARSLQKARVSFFSSKFMEMELLPLSLLGRTKGFMTLSRNKKKYIA